MKNNQKMSNSKMLLDLIFTFFIPIGILSPNLLGSGFSVAKNIFGGGTDGNIKSYVLAAIVPVFYVLWDIIKNKNLSPIAIMGAIGAFFSGALAFWYVDGFLYAIKDSARMYLMGIAFVISGLINVPLLKVFFEAFLFLEENNKKEAMLKILNHEKILKALCLSTIIMGGIDIFAGIINTIVNYKIVTASFGTDQFNAQVAQANAVMRLPSMIISMIGLVLALNILQKNIKKAIGEDFKIF